MTEARWCRCAADFKRQQKNKVVQGNDVICLYFMHIQTVDITAFGVVKTHKLYWTVAANTKCIDNNNHLTASFLGNLGKPVPER